MLNGHTEAELTLAVRQEKAVLIREKTAIINRLNQIHDRLGELDKAENLLEGGF